MNNDTAQEKLAAYMATLNIHEVALFGSILKQIEGVHEIAIEAHHADGGRLFNDAILVIAEHIKEQLSPPAHVEPHAEKHPNQVDDWINWTGGDCPVSDDAEVQLKFRDGEVIDSRTNPTSWRWRHDGNDLDITAYRVIDGGEA